jgi:hypothetical protein
MSISKARRRRIKKFKNFDFSRSWIASKAVIVNSKGTLSSTPLELSDLGLREESSAPLDDWIAIFEDLKSAGWKSMQMYGEEDWFRIILERPATPEEKEAWDRAHAEHERKKREKEEAKERALYARLKKKYE